MSISVLENLQVQVGHIQRITMRARPNLPTAQVSIYLGYLGAIRSWKRPKASGRCRSCRCRDVMLCFCSKEANLRRRKRTPRNGIWHCLYTCTGNPIEVLDNLGNCNRKWRKRPSRLVGRLQATPATLLPGAQLLGSSMMSHPR